MQGRGTQHQSIGSEERNVRARGADFAAAERWDRPSAVCRRLGIELCIFVECLELPGKAVHGCWDPVLRRIEIHGVRELTDAALVGVFAHELHHATAGALLCRDEDAAEAFAGGFLMALPADVVRRLARAIREAAAEAVTLPTEPGQAARWIF